MKWRAYGKVAGTKYLGEVEADAEEQAIEKAEALGSCCVSLCHQCSDQCEDPEIDEITVEREEPQ